MKLVEKLPDLNTNTLDIYNWMCLEIRCNVMGEMDLSIGFKR